MGWIAVWQDGCGWIDADEGGWSWVTTGGWIGILGVGVGSRDSWCSRRLSGRNKQQATSKLEDSIANEPLILLLIDSIIQMATTKTAKGKAAAAKCAFLKPPENHPPAKILT